MEHAQKQPGIQTVGFGAHDACSYDGTPQPLQKMAIHNGEQPNTVIGIYT